MQIVITFGCFFRYQGGLDAGETQLMQQFTTFLADFTKGKMDDDQWPRFRPGQGQYMIFDNPLSLSRKLLFPAQRIKFWMQEIFHHPEDILSDFEELD